MEKTLRTQGTLFSDKSRNIETCLLDSPDFFYYFCEIAPLSVFVNQFMDYNAKFSAHILQCGERTRSTMVKVGRVEVNESDRSQKTFFGALSLVAMPCNFLVSLFSSFFSGGQPLVAALS